MSGKGSAPRPFEVDRKTFESNWDAIFGRKKDSEQPQEAVDDQRSKQDDVVETQ